MLVLGDSHASDPDKRDALLAAYEAADADVALHVGDLEHYDPPVTTYFIAGNNEDFDVIGSMRENATLGERNARLLASTTADVQGVRVAGLSGNYSPTRYGKSRDELSGDRRRHFTREDVRAATELDGVDVFLTHESPQGFLGRGSARVDDILRALRPDLSGRSPSPPREGTVRGDAPRRLGAGLGELLPARPGDARTGALRRAQMIRSPNALAVSSTANCAVSLCSSRMGLTSTSSIDRNASLRSSRSATFSIAEWASR